MSISKCPPLWFLSGTELTQRKLKGTFLFGRKGTLLLCADILLTVVAEDKPYVTKGNRLLIKDMGKNFYWVRVFYGFMETPDIPAALEQCATQGLPFDMMSTSFFISRALIVSSPNPGMMKWREQLFLALSRNAMNVADFFKIPVNRVIEMGTKIEI